MAVDLRFRNSLINEKDTIVMKIVNQEKILSMCRDTESIMTCRGIIQENHQRLLEIQKLLVDDRFKNLVERQRENMYEQIMVQILQRISRDNRDRMQELKESSASVDIPRILTGYYFFFGGGGNSIQTQALFIQHKTQTLRYMITDYLDQSITQTEFLLDFNSEYNNDELNYLIDISCQKS